MVTFNQVSGYSVLRVINENKKNLLDVILVSAYRKLVCRWESNFGFSKL